MKLAVKEKEDKDKNKRRPPFKRSNYNDPDVREEHRYNGMDDNYKSGGYISKVQKDMERHPYYYESSRIFESVEFI